MTNNKMSAEEIAKSLEEIAHGSFHMVKVDDAELLRTAAKMLRTNVAAVQEGISCIDTFIKLMNVPADSLFHRHLESMKKALGGPNV